MNELTATALGTSSMVAAVHHDMHDNTTKIKEDDCVCLYVCLCVCDREREKEREREREREEGEGNVKMHTGIPLFATCYLM